MEKDRHSIQHMEHVVQTEAPGGCSGLSRDFLLQTDVSPDVSFQQNNGIPASSFIQEKVRDEYE